MQIELTGGNKKLIQEYLLEQYKAQLCEKSNRWKARLKHMERGDKAIEILYRHLLLDTDVHNIQIDIEHSCLVVMPKMEILKR